MNTRLTSCIAIYLHKSSSDLFLVPDKMLMERTGSPPELVQVSGCGFLSGSAQRHSKKTGRLVVRWGQTGGTMVNFCDLPSVQQLEHNVIWLRGWWFCCLFQ